ncbi:zinc finger protein 195-like [Armigeres subalbatus]|uniref:zinc finger protein 195-like n=1 Tax=Armigeres subalbatus TaxID=124917 RepID=UPI002ED6621A
MDMEIQDHQMNIQTTVTPTPQEFISLHGWMLSQLNLKKVISSEFSAEQNCKNVLQCIDNFSWPSDKKENIKNKYVQLMAKPCLTSAESSSNLEQELPKENVKSDNKIVKKSTKSTKRRFKLYVNSEFSCQPCARNFASRAGYTQHCKAHHSGSFDHRCGKCGRRFHTEAKAKLHERLHSMKDKPFKCSKCTKQFIYIQDLRRHGLKQHGEGGRYVCKVCGLKCIRSDALALHEFSHTKKTG